MFSRSRSSESISIDRAAIQPDRSRTVGASVPVGRWKLLRRGEPIPAVLGSTSRCSAVQGGLSPAGSAKVKLRVRSKGG